MKIVQFQVNDGKQKIGVLNGENVIDVSFLSDLSNNLVELLEKENICDLLKEKASCKDCPSYPLSIIQLLAPITKPDKIIGIGLNFKEHCDKMNIPHPKIPIVFNKFPSCVVGPFDDVKKPSASNSVDWEVELVVVIGKKAKNVKASEAFDYIFGYTSCQDLTAKDWWAKKEVMMAKNMDQFLPLGPWVVTKDEIPDPHDINVKTWVNGELKQNGNTKELIHRIDNLIEYISSVMTLLPGDLILTGTPSGVGATQNPPQFLEKSDVLESEVEKIGKMRNNIV